MSSVARFDNRITRLFGVDVPIAREDIKRVRDMTELSP